jgi:dynein heavy chain, axonemal
MTNNKMAIADTVFVGSIGPHNGDNKHFISSRFIRHFNIVSIDAFDADLLKSIFQPIIKWYFTRYAFEKEYHKFGQIIIDATLSVYERVLNLFRPIPSKSHYLFNLRDFKRVIQVNINLIFFFYVRYQKLMLFCEFILSWKKVEKKTNGESSPVRD